MIELKDHPYFVACQFHPEFKSRPAEPPPALRPLRPRGARARDAARSSGEMRKPSSTQPEVN